MSKEDPDAEFPKYLMKVAGERQFFILAGAARAYNCGHVPVEFGRYVLNADFSVRKMEEADRAKISSLADKYSASK